MLFEYSVNEKIAVEIAFAASLTGARAGTSRRASRRVRGSTLPSFDDDPWPADRLARLWDAFPAWAMICSTTSSRSIRAFLLAQWVCRQALGQIQVAIAAMIRSDSAYHKTELRLAA